MEERVKIEFRLQTGAGTPGNIPMLHPSFAMGAWKRVQNLMEALTGDHAIEPESITPGSLIITYPVQPRLAASIEDILSQVSGHSTAITAHLSYKVKEAINSFQEYVKRGNILAAITAEDKNLLNLTKETNYHFVLPKKKLPWTSITLVGNVVSVAVDPHRIGLMGDWGGLIEIEVPSDFQALYFNHELFTKKWRFSVRVKEKNGQIRKAAYINHAEVSLDNDFDKKMAAFYKENEQIWRGKGTAFLAEIRD